LPRSGRWNNKNTATQRARLFRRVSQARGDEWDNLAVKTQREEISSRISELGSDVSERTTLPSLSQVHEIAILQCLLSTRKDDVVASLRRKVSLLRGLKNSATPVSHVQKEQMRADYFTMKSEIAFLDQRMVDLRRFGTTIEVDNLWSESNTEEIVLQAMFHKDPSTRNMQEGRHQTRNLKQKCGKRFRSFGSAITGKFRHLKGILLSSPLSALLKSVIERTLAFLWYKGGCRGPCW